MLQDAFLLILAALPLMGSPGPATLSVAGTGMAFGVKKGLFYLAGIIAGTFGVLLLIASGVTALILANPALVTGISILAAGYILYLAWKIATAPVLSQQSVNTKAPTFSSAFILAIANPKAFAAIGAVYSSHILVPGDLFQDGAVKIGVLTLVIIAVNSAWLGFGAGLSAFLRDPTTGRIANVAFAIMLLASVVYAVYGLLFP